MWRGEAQVFIASYETVRTDLADGEHVNRDWDVVVIDEAQRIKNPEADISEYQTVSRVTEADIFEFTPALEFRRTLRFFQSPGLDFDIHDFLNALKCNCRF